MSRRFLPIPFRGSVRRSSLIRRSRFGSDRPEVPEEVEALVRRCLEKNPRDRFQSVPELMRALEALLPRRARALPSLPPVATGQHGVSTNAPTVAILPDESDSASALPERPEKPDLSLSHGPVATPHIEPLTSSKALRGRAAWIVGLVLAAGVAGGLLALPRASTPPSSSAAPTAARSVVADSVHESPRADLERGSLGVSQPIAVGVGVGCDCGRSGGFRIGFAGRVGSVDATHAAGAPSRNDSNPRCHTALDGARHPDAALMGLVLARWLMAAAMALTVCLFVHRAFADDVADEADLRFSLGAEAYQRGDYRTALEHFHVSNRLVPNRNVVFNIGRCYEQLGKFPEAFRYYTQALEGEPDKAARERIEAMLTRLRANVALFEVSSDPPGATLYIDRRDLGARGESPRSLGLSPGRYKMIAELSGYYPAETTVENKQLGSSVEVSLKLEPILGRVRDRRGSHRRRCARRR